MEELKFGFEIIRKRLGLEGNISFEKGADGFTVSKKDEGILITYGTKRDAFRALTFVKEVQKTGKTVSQKASFNMLCYMADMSRNAVMNMEAVKDLIVDLAMMGYDSMMLYIEDTYEIPESPYFGYMRGRYTQEQMKEIDRFGIEMGIEVIPCMQTLAHLATLLRWKHFLDVKDTSSILLADCDKTYELIENMFKSLSSCFSTKKIHLGMDEAHDLGLGKYLDINGYHTRFEILSKHLIRVKGLCDKYDLEPMIWSDMYFRIHTGGAYYMSKGELPDEYVSLVPDGVGIVYWDYYSTDAKTLDCMFRSHAKFKGDTIFAGGAWKWSGFAPFTRITHECANIHIDACIRNGCKDIIVTGWGDNGAEASQFSILPGLAIYAERCFDSSLYNGNADSDKIFAKRFEDTFGISLEAFYALDLANEIFDEPVESHANPCKFAFYNGVLGGIVDMHIPDGANERYKKYVRTLEKYADNPRFGYMFETMAKLCKVLSLKAEMSKDIRKAYHSGDRDILEKYIGEILPETAVLLDDFLETFRRQWYKENKTIGFEVHEIRIGGLLQTVLSAAGRLESFLSGETDEIEELSYPLLPFQTEKDGSPKKQLILNRWADNSTASVM